MCHVSCVMCHVYELRMVAAGTLSALFGRDDSAWARATRAIYIARGLLPPLAALVSTRGTGQTLIARLLEATVPCRYSRRYPAHGVLWRRVCYSGLRGDDSARAPSESETLMVGVRSFGEQG
jgi:hypothetical protein